MMSMATFTDKGGKRRNEDTVRCVKTEGNCVAVVADGLGGHGGGEIASAIAVDTIIDGFVKDASIEKDAIQRYFAEAHRQIVEIQSPARRMKTTAAALFIQNNTALWGHVGDSRLYRFKDGVLAEQTLDHSVSQMAVLSGEITKEQIRHHVDRNKLVKALGGSGEGLKAELSDLCRLDSGFHAFLLCSDGFWEYVLESEMEKELVKAQTPGGWIAAMLQRHRERAPKDHDNYSAAAVFLRPNKDHR